MLCTMALPREFRRWRVALVGFGDVARRLLTQRMAANGGTRHGPKFIAAGRSRPEYLTRSHVPAGSATSRHQWLSCNLDDHRAVQRLVRISQAAVLLAPPADLPGPSATKDMRMRRWASCVRATGRSIPGVYISTTGVYGDHQGDVVTETTVCRPGQARSMRRLDAETSLRSLGIHILRTPGIYAADRLPVVRLKAAQPALQREDDVWTNHIHADDLARMAWIGLWRGKPGRVTNAVDESELRMGDYFDKVADALHLPRPPRVSRQEMQVQAASGRISPMAMSFLSESRRIRSNRLTMELRVWLRYPTVDDGLRDACQAACVGAVSPTSSAAQRP